jgi:hypothetical protein
MKERRNFILKQQGDYVVTVTHDTVTGLNHFQFRQKIEGHKTFDSKYEMFLENSELVGLVNFLNDCLHNEETK